MSNLSDIGFPVKSDEQVNEILMGVLPSLTQILAPPLGGYYLFDDQSGARLYLQANMAQDLVGFNPSFRGETLIDAYGIRFFGRDTSELDGGALAVVKVVETGKEISVVFDLPNFAAIDRDKDSYKVNLNAFATNDLQCVEDSAIDKITDMNFEAISLFGVDGLKLDAPQAHARISGIVSSAELRKNNKSGENFYHAIIETSIGEIDVVSDPKFLNETPAKGEIIRGSFWISGRIEI